ncbi:hypothetical protein EV360DRAFT_54935 [Lentinula raphanica]|nr:hypothetical protein EV360DRAFT_54935 [Lentinula raphanica]
MQRPLAQKLATRLGITGIMIDFYKDIPHSEAKSFWNYVAQALQVLGEPGMSDEEDGQEDVVIDGVETTQDVKLVKILWFRHESFSTLFQIVDGTPKAERRIFTQAGRQPTKRIRSDSIVDYRSPPRGYPEGIYRQEYLQKLKVHEREDLELQGTFIIAGDIRTD